MRAKYVELSRLSLVGSALSVPFAASYLFRRPPALGLFKLQMGIATSLLITGVLLRALPPRGARAVQLLLTAAMPVVLLLIAIESGDLNDLTFSLLLIMPVLVSFLFKGDVAVAAVASVAAIGLGVIGMLKLGAPPTHAGQWALYGIITGTFSVYGALRFARARDIEHAVVELDLARVTSALANSAGTFVRYRAESDMLEVALAALAAQGWKPTLYLLHDGPPRDLQGAPAGEAVAAELARAIEARRPVLEPMPGGTQSRVVVPVFVEAKAFACFWLTGTIKDANAAAIELFAQSVGAALENIASHRRAAERLTELTRLQEELVARERLAALGEAAAVVAHEVRNPLGAIVNSVSLLKREAIEPQRSVELLRLIEEEAMRLDGLVHDLLFLGRPLAPKLKPLDVVEFCRQTLAQVRAQADFSSVTFKLEVHGDVAPVPGDPDHLYLALSNLLRNAAQASPHGATVTVSVKSGDAGVSVAVDDQGSGVAPAQLERIFEPFFTQRSAGTGLGLAIVKQVIRAHNGTVRVDSNPSGGARFEFFLASA